MARSDIVVATLTTAKAAVDLVHGCVNVYQGIDDGGSVDRRQCETSETHGEVERWVIRG